MLKLDLIHTLAFAGIVLYCGYGVRRMVPVLARYNIPAPVIGGLLIAAIILLARQRGRDLVQFDTALQSPLMIAFFTAVGFSASFALLKKGGVLVILLLALATLFAVAQNAIGLSLAVLLGVPPLFGVIVGSVTLAGGPATGLAFAPLFEQAGVAGAAAVAVASAMSGIIMASWLGNPLGTFLIRRHRLKEENAPQPDDGQKRAAQSGQHYTGAGLQLVEPRAMLHSVVLILAAMWAGAWISRGLTAMGITLPAYIGAMLAAAMLRNLDDKTRWLALSPPTIEALGSVALSLFIVMALMTLKLWELAGLAAPLLIVLAAQAAFMAAVCLGPVFRWLGKDYEAAVMSSGFCGFMLGTTANAVANMEALVERYGPAPRAFLAVPMVGAFFIDFTNALIITACLNMWK